MVGRGWLIGVASVAVAGCGVTKHEPQLVWEGGGGARVEVAAAAARVLASAGPGVRRGVWGEGTDATYHLLETEVAEPPHVHAHHDLAVVVLRGRGTLFVEGRRMEVGTGDVLHIGRGRVHHFHPAPGTTVLGLAIYTPRLEIPDFVLTGPP